MGDVFNVMGPRDLVDEVLAIIPGTRVTDTWSKKDAPIRDLNVEVDYDVCDRLVEACEDRHLTCKLI